MLGFRRRLGPALMCGLLFSSPVFAHPGHGRGGGDWTALHYLIEPLHLFIAVPLLALAALAAGRAFGLLRPRQSRQGSR